MHVLAWFAKWKSVHLFTSLESLGHVALFVCLFWWLEELRAGFRFSRWLRNHFSALVGKSYRLLFLEKFGCVFFFLTTFWE